MSQMKFLQRIYNYIPVTMHKFGDFVHAPMN